jgi:N utilization substance protein B
LNELTTNLSERAVKDRRAARKLALDVLYEAEIRDLLPLDALSSKGVQGWVRSPPGEDDAVGENGPAPEAVRYARQLIEGIQAHQADIDALIARYADRWAIQRMPVVDRVLLRIAMFELLWCDDIPVAVAINEAVELAKSLSTDDSGRFINGLLGRVAESRQA